MLFRVLGYLKKYPRETIKLSADNNYTLKCYVDAAYGVHWDGKSHSGVFLTLGRGPIYVGSSKQKIVTRSSFEAEVTSVSDAGTVIIWVNDLLNELGICNGPAVIFQDNLGVVSALRNGNISRRNSKHIKIRQL
jgi:hypothetical protein